MHVDRGRLERWVAGELGARERQATELHIPVCDTCKDLLEEVRVARLLTHIDEPPPPVSHLDLMARARRRAMPGYARWVAGFALTVLAAGAVYAAPGSPLPGLLSRSSADTGRAPEAPAQGQDIAGVVVPVGERLEIEIHPQEAGTIRVLVADVSDASVEALNGPATFDSRESRLVVQGASPADYRITLPAIGGSVEVFVGETSVLRLEAGEVTTIAAPDGRQGYSLRFGDVSPAAGR